MQNKPSDELTQLAKSKYQNSKAQFHNELLDHIYAPIITGLDSVRSNIKNISKDQEPSLKSLLEHILGEPGKQVRPAITLLTANFYKHDKNTVESMATAIELLHTAALLHDDTIDASDFRRGKSSVSSLWGRNKAIVLGDFLLATSTIFVSDTENMSAIKKYFDLAVNLAKGELNEMDDAFNANQTKQQYFKRIYRKTASLFMTAAEAGSILSDAPEHISNDFKNYGYNLGMAFQILDDILDFDATKEEVGKPVANDLANGILTLPAILAIEQYPTNNPITKFFNRLKHESEPNSSLTQDELARALILIRNSSVIDQSYGIVKDFCKTALDSLKNLPPNQSRESLEELVYVLETRRN